jgi:hypothetical protein
VELYDVWRVTYATYEEVAREGDKKPVRVARNLPLAKALALVEQLGFAHCAKLADDD